MCSSLEEMPCCMITHPVRKLRLSPISPKKKQRANPRSLILNIEGATDRYRLKVEVNENKHTYILILYCMLYGTKN